MPFYDFDCKGCGKKFQYKLGMNEERPTECKECGGELTRDFSGIGVIAHSKNDPGSPMYWKKGKSASDIADVITDTKQPY